VNNVITTQVNNAVRFLMIIHSLVVKIEVDLSWSWPEYYN